MALRQSDYTRIEAKPVFLEIAGSAEKPLTPQSFGKKALELVEVEIWQDGYRTIDGDRYNLASTVHDFVTAQEKLDALQDAPGRIREPYLEKVIHFNHALKELIDNDNHAEFDAVKAFVVHTYTALHPEEFKSHPDQVAARARHEKIKGYVDNVLRGMRAEIAVDQILGIKYETDSEVSVAEELRGIDLYVKPGDAYIAVDVAASHSSAEKKRAKQLYRNDRVVLSSPVRASDFPGNGFRLSPDTVTQKFDSLDRQLYDELERTNQL